MDKYLAVTTTILIISQVIRVTQNAINLHRQKIMFERDLKGLSDLELTKEDFRMQQRFYRLAVRKMEREEKLLQTMNYEDDGEW